MAKEPNAETRAAMERARAMQARFATPDELFESLESQPVQPDIIQRLRDYHAGESIARADPELAQLHYDVETIIANLRCEVEELKLKLAAHRKDVDK